MGRTLGDLDSISFEDGEHHSRYLLASLFFFPSSMGRFVSECLDLVLGHGCCLVLEISKHEDVNLCSLVAHK